MRSIITGAFLGTVAIVALATATNHQPRSYATPTLQTIAAVKPASTPKIVKPAAVAQRPVVVVQAAQAIAPAALPSPAPTPATLAPTPIVTPSHVSTPPVLPGSCAGSQSTEFYNDGQSEGFTSLCTGANLLPSDSSDNFAVGLAQPGYVYHFNPDPLPVYEQASS